VTTGFSIGDALSFGWNAFKERMGFFIGLIIVTYLAYGIPYGIGMALMEKAAPLGIILVLIGVVVGVVLGTGWISIILKVVDGQPVSFGDLTSATPKIVSYIIGAILYSVAVNIGTLLLVVPGIILGVRLMLYPFTIIDSNDGPVAGLQRSWDITRGNFWKLVAFIIVLAVLNFVGALILIVGLLVTVPMSMIASGYVYRRLSGGTEAVRSAAFSPQPGL